MKCSFCGRNIGEVVARPGALVRCRYCGVAMVVTHPDDAGRPGGQACVGQASRWDRYGQVARSIGVAIAVLLVIVVLSIAFLRSSGTWVTISYGPLVDRTQIVGNGETLGSALAREDQKGAVQPFLDGYSRLLSAAVQMRNGPDPVPLCDVADLFEPGDAQPAWVALCRTGRLRVLTSGRGMARVFLLGDDPVSAYERHYGVVRHALGMLAQQSGPLRAEIYAYRHDYAKSELSLYTKPHIVESRAFGPSKAAVDLEGLASFFAAGPVLEGARISGKHGLVLYGTEGEPQTLAGKQVALSDLAVAYRAVLHAGDNDAFVSLDPHADVTKSTVNFGGYLEDTRIGRVVLEADKRFKTITCGLDPDTGQDVRYATRAVVQAFQTNAERDLMIEGEDDGRWIGTRFWYYPDVVGVDCDLNWEYAALDKPRFTADAERSRDDFASHEDFEASRRAQLSPSVRACIDHLNQNHTDYARAFPELSELTTVARLMGVCSWLAKADNREVDLDGLLGVTLPPCRTERERDKLIAATVAKRRTGTGAVSHAQLQKSLTYYLTPLLNRSVGRVFGSEAKVRRFANDKDRLARGTTDVFRRMASGEFELLRSSKVREVMTCKRDLELLVEYWAESANAPEVESEVELSGQIAADRRALDRLKATIGLLKRALDGAGSVEEFNRLVDRHNAVVRTHRMTLERHNRLVRQFNALRFRVRYILAIGGGISLRPSEFKVRQDPSSPALRELMAASSRASAEWSEIGVGRRWVSSLRTDALKRGRPHALAVPPQWRRALRGVERWAKTGPQEGSWRSAVHVGQGRWLEHSFDGGSRSLQIASFAHDHLESLIIGRFNDTGSIVFSRSDRTSVLLPTSPPVWFGSEEGGSASGTR